MSNEITLDMNSTSVQYLCMKDKRLSKLMQIIGPITYTPHSDDPYSFLVHEIIEQMLSVKAGQKIFDRLQTLCGGHVTVEAVLSLSDNQLRSTGTSNAKVEYIRNVTNAITDGVLSFDLLSELPDEEVIKCLTKNRGIGNWTAKMYLMFVLDRPDVLPFEDGAFLQVYRWLYRQEDTSPASVCKRCKKWEPYSSIAARFFYRALDLGMTKEPFHLYKKRGEII